MALSVDTGIVNANTGSATTTITVTAQGKAIILFTTGQTAEGTDSAANAMWSIGFSDGTNHRCISWASDDNVGTTNCGRSYSATRSLEVLSNGTPTIVRGITGVAFTDATTTTLTWDGTPAAAYKVGYMQVGGSDITNVLVGSHTMANSTGDKTETGVGFQGDFGMFLFGGATGAGTSTRANLSVGFACRVNDSGTSRARQFGMSWGIDDGATMTANIDAVSYTNSSNFLSYITDGAETIDVLAQFGTASEPLGFASDGFRYNISNASATNAQLLYYLIIKGGQWDVGTIDPASSLVVSSMTFQPKGIAVANSHASATATVTTTATSSFGAASSTTTEASVGARQDDAVLNTAVYRVTQTDRIAHDNPAATSGWNLNAVASNGFTLAGQGAPGNRLLGWFAAGDNASVVPSPNVSDTVTITESAPLSLLSYINRSDTASMTDTPVLNLLSYIDVFDTATMSESVVAVLVNAISVNDTVTISEALDTILQSYIDVSDTATMSEIVSLFLPYLTPEVSDTATVTDTPSLSLQSFILVSDTATITESATLLVVVTMTVSDTVNLSELTDVNLRSFISVADTATLSETVLASLTSYINVSDTASLSEQVNQMIQSYLAVSDTATVSDSPTLSLLSFINVSDTASISETVVLVVTAADLLVFSVFDTVTMTELVTIAITGAGTLISVSPVRIGYPNASLTDGTNVGSVGTIGG